MPPKFNSQYWLDNWGIGNFNPLDNSLNNFLDNSQNVPSLNYNVPNLNWDNLMQPEQTTYLQYGGTPVNGNAKTDWLKKNPTPGIDASSIVGTPGLQNNQSAPKMQGPSKLPGTDPPEKQSLGDKFENSFIGQHAAAFGAGADAIGNIAGAFDKKAYEGPHGETRLAIDQGWNSLSDAAMKMGPYGQMAGLAMKAVGALNSVQNAALGNKALDNMTTMDAITGSPLGFLTGVGLINALGGLNADTITKNEEAFSQVGSSYAGTGNAVDDALTKSGKRYGLFSGSARKQANAEIAEATRQLNIMSGIADESSIRLTLQGTMSNINSVANNFAGMGGYQLANVRAAKFGMRLERAKSIVNRPKISIEITYEETPKFKEGGIIEPIIEEISTSEIEIIEEIIIPEFQKGGEINLIPEGALHARKHNITEINEELKGLITEKGIPVISEDPETGEVQQHAEIEHSEIIFRLEVTELIEEARKKYDSKGTKQSEKDLIAIEIGKLLVQEILYNTDDKTNLINNV